MAAITPLSTRHAKPHFLIVGAPRCGTTALSEFLNQHPALYLSYVKEPHYFGSDLDIRRGFHTERDYRALFQDATPNQLCGEASTWYLFSQCAAEEIHAFNPKAKIIIMLRNPAEMIYSWHGYMVLKGGEPHEDFAQALRAESERRQGHHIPKNTPAHKLIYTDIPRYTAQIERYRTVFDASNIHIILYDDFKADQQLAIKNTFAFLGVDADFTPDMTIVNAHGTVKSKALRNITENQPESVRRVVRALLPFKLRFRLLRALRLGNTKPDTRAPLPVDQRQQLNAVFAEEVAQLEQLINTDLAHWTN